MVCAAFSYFFFCCFSFLLLFFFFSFILLFFSFFLLSFLFSFSYSSRCCFLNIGVRLTYILFVLKFILQNFFKCILYIYTSIYLRMYISVIYKSNTSFWTVSYAFIPQHQVWVDKFSISYRFLKIFDTFYYIIMHVYNCLYTYTFTHV